MGHVLADSALACACLLVLVPGCCKSAQPQRRVPDGGALAPAWLYVVTRSHWGSAYDLGIADKQQAERILATTMPGPSLDNARMSLESVIEQATGLPVVYAPPWSPGLIETLGHRPYEDWYDFVVTKSGDEPNVASFLKALLEDDIGGGGSVLRMRPALLDSSPELPPDLTRYHWLSCVMFRERALVNTLFPVER